MSNTEEQLRAVRIVGEFDRRNGTDRVSTGIREILEAEPLVDHLPLGRAGGHA